MTHAVTHAVTPPPPPPTMPTTSCACVHNGVTLHRPPDATRAGAAGDSPTTTTPACFVPTAIADEPLLIHADPFHCREGTQADGGASGHDDDIQDPSCDAETVFSEHCYVRTPTLQALSRIAECLTPRRVPPDQRALFLVGDSHAAHLVPGLQRAVTRASGGMAFAWFGLPGRHCGFISDARDMRDGVCGQARQRMRATLAARVRENDAVVLAHVAYKFTDSQPAFLRAFHHDVLAPVGGRLVLMGDAPVLERMAVYCLNNPRLCEVGSDWAPTWWKGAMARKDAAWRQLADESPTVHYFRIHDLFCAEGRCGAVVPGTPTFAFFDTTHLTRAGGLYLWPFLCSWLREARILP